MLIAHMKQGFSFGTFGAVVDAGEKTLYEWSYTFPEFKEAKEKGREYAQKHVESLALAKMRGVNLKDSNGKEIKVKDIDTTMTLFFLKTRFNRDYSEKSQAEREALTEGLKKANVIIKLPDNGKTAV